MTTADFSRYAALVSALAEPALARELCPADDAGASVALGVPAARVMLAGASRSVDAPMEHGPAHALAEGLKALAAASRQPRRGTAPPALLNPWGPTCDAHYGFVLHLHLAAFGACYESLSDSAWGACEDAITDAIQPARAVEEFAGNPPAETAGTVRAVARLVSLRARGIALARRRRRVHRCGRPAGDRPRR